MKDSPLPQRFFRVVFQQQMIIEIQAVDHKAAYDIGQAEVDRVSEIMAVSLEAGSPRACRTFDFVRFGQVSVTEFKPEA